MSFFSMRVFNTWSKNCCTVLAVRCENRQVVKSVWQKNPKIDLKSATRLTGKEEKINTRKKIGVRSENDLQAGIRIGLFPWIILFGRYSGFL